MTQELAVQRACVPKILAHPFGRSSRHSVTHTQRARRCRRLQFIGQRVIVPAVAVVQKTSDGAEKIHCRRGKLFLCGGDISNPLFFLDDLPQPNRRLVIPQAAWRLFHVGFEVKNRISVARQSFSGKPVNLRQQEGPRLLFRCGQHFRVQLLEERRIARQEPAIQQCQVELRIVFFDPPAFFQRPPCRADAKSDVPQGPRKFGDERPRFLLYFLVSQQK